MGLRWILACCLLVGCVPQNGNEAFDESEAASHIAAQLAASKHFDEQTPDSPDEPDSDGCENCSDTGWLGDGQPRNSCPVCNDPIVKPKPSVQDYLRQLREWQDRQRVSSGQAPYWSPTKEAWERLNGKVDDVESRVNALESNKSPAKQSAAPKSMQLIMHSREACLPCETWWQYSAQKFAPTNRGDYYAGRIDGIPITVTRDKIHQGKTTPWWTLIATDGTRYEFPNGTVLRPELISSYGIK